MGAGLERRIDYRVEPAPRAEISSATEPGAGRAHDSCDRFIYSGPFVQ
jgi:hypothetical protein